MTYLLDVSVLLAAGYDYHLLHTRAKRWLEGIQMTDSAPRLITCSITELGFVRIASGTTGLSSSVTRAQMDLNRLKEKWSLTFVGDNLDASQLPPWVNKSKQVTDGHLLQLAVNHGGILATLDKGIPGALLIPNVADPPGVKEPRLPYGVAA